MLNKFKLLLSSEAKQDIDEVAEYYEAQQDDLGQKFEDDLDEQLERLKSFPQMYAKFNKYARKGNLEKFPYSFYYQEDMPQELVDILGVFAQVRNPEAIQNELERRQKK